jgi:hypothetical protein
MDDCVVSVVEPGISVSVVMGTKVASVAAAPSEQPAKEI